MQEQHIINIEKVVLSSILFTPERFEEVASDLKINDFLLQLHRDIFEMCMFLSNSNLPIGSDLILSKMPPNKKITPQDLLEIEAINPIANIEAYIDEIKEASIKRELHSLANLLREKSLDSEQSSENIIDEISQRVYDISVDRTSDELITSHEMVSDILTHITELKNRASVLVGLDTGFKKLNLLTTGFNAGDFIIIGARPAMGKTSLALNIAQSILNQNKGVVIFSLEMPFRQLGMRMLSSNSSIPLQNLRTGKLDDNDLTKLTSTMDTLGRQPLWIFDAKLLTIAKLRKNLRQLKRKNDNIEVAIIDYLQLMEGNNKTGGKQFEISEISRGLKILARELKIPIIALSQLNRSVEHRDDKRPSLADLRDSGAIEQDADVILFLYRNDVYAKRADKEREARLKKEGKEKEFKPEHKEREIEPAELIVAKNRNGENGTIEILFNKRYTRFEDKIDDMDRQMSETRIEGEEFMNQVGNIDTPFIS